MIDIVEAIEDDVEDVVEQPSPQAVPQPVPQVNNEALANRIASEVLSKLAPQGPARTSALALAAQELLDEGVPEIAIKRILKLNEAQKADEAASAQAYHAAQAAQGFNDTCWQIAADQLDDYAKNIPILANAREGLKKDLLRDISETIASDSDQNMVAIRASIASGRYPERTKVGKVVAKVVDAWLVENGLTKKAVPQDLKNSKVEAPNAAVDMDDFSKGARQIYAQVLKHTGDEQKALKRARDLMAGK